MPGRSKLALPPLRSSSSFGRHASEEEVDTAALRKRFDKQLPKYGFLWRSMAHAKMGGEEEKEEGSGVKKGGAVDLGEEKSNKAARERAADDKENEEPPHGRNANEPPSLLNAILNKQPVSLRVPANHLCGEGCDDCADPIVEIIDEDASVYDVNVDEELVDTDDEAGNEPSKSAKGSADGGKGIADSVEVGEDVELNTSSQTNVSSMDSDEESVLMISKTPRKKAFVLDSDEESDDDEAIESAGEKSGEGDAEPEDGETLGAESERSIDSVEDDADADFEVPRPLAEYSEGSASSSNATGSGRPTRRRKPTAKAKYVDVLSDDSSQASSSSKEEWVELSSDEEGEQPAPRVNTVVILSDDDEEDSKSENDDAHSAFTISDSDSDESEDSIVGKARDRRPAPRKATSSKPATKRKPAAPRTKPAKSVATPKKNKQSNATAASGPRSTLAFRKNREALTSHTFAEFDRKAFNGALGSVKVTWSNKLNTTAGITRMRGKLGEKHASTRVATIELATKVIDDEERLRSTLLHEMCHAAQWIVDGTHKPAHGKAFKKWAAVSMRKVRDVEVTTTHEYFIAYKFAWACTSKNCTVIIKRHSRSVDPTKQCCGRCKGRLIEIEVPREGETGYTAKKERKASEFALFVKSQSKSVKKSLAQQRSCTPKEVSQSDVMKECGKLWRERKASSNGGTKKDAFDLADRLVDLTLNGGES
ncbi:hypothetical protein ACHAXT_002267 [Thalassiosira profunda]